MAIGHLRRYKFPFTGKAPRRIGIGVLLIRVVISRCRIIIISTGIYQLLPPSILIVFSCCQSTNSVIRQDSMHWHMLSITSMDFWPTKFLVSENLISIWLPEEMVFISIAVRITMKSFLVLIISSNNSGLILYNLTWTGRPGKTVSASALAGYQEEGEMTGPDD